MKKLVLILVIMVFTLAGYSQRSLNSNRVVTVLDSVDASAFTADTSIVYKNPRGIWGATFEWYGTSTADTAYIYFANDYDARIVFNPDDQNTYRIPMPTTDSTAARAGTQPEFGFIVFKIPKMTGFIKLEVYTD